MSYIKAIIGGKKIGIADQVAIDPAIGCKNKCVGCYAKKSSQRGKNYEKVVKRRFNRKVLQGSIRKAKSKGFDMARVGKHCDPGNHIDNLICILECCNGESFRCVVVSKSLKFSYTISELLKDGNHILHMSLGPYSTVVPTDDDIIDVALLYRGVGVNVVIRVTRDITECMLDSDRNVMKYLPYIVTPMRYASREIMSFYHHNDPHEEDFDFVAGYWRPNKTHPDWLRYMDKVCGEINGEVRCCECNTKN